MSETVAPGGTVTLRTTGWTPGLAGTIGVEILQQSDRTVVIPRTTTGITADPVDARTYRYTLSPAPSTPGEFLVYWTDAPSSPTEWSEQELVISTGLAAATGAFDLTSLPEVRAHLEISHTTHDDLIDALITAASRAIMRRYSRELRPQVTATRRLRVTGQLVDLGEWDLRSATTVTLHPESASPQVLGGSQVMLEPIGADPFTGTYTRLRLGASVSLASTTAREFGYALMDVAGAWGAWGPADIPDDIRRAAVITVGSWMDRAVGEYGMDLDGGREVLPDRGATWAIPMAAHRLLQHLDRIVLA